jgi:hypothetical protein
MDTGKSNTTLAPNGHGVRRWTAPIRSLVPASSIQVTASMPSPPAFETAAASSAEAADPTGACTMGRSIPRRPHSGVLSVVTNWPSRSGWVFVPTPRPTAAAAPAYVAGDRGSVLMPWQQRFSANILVRLGQPLNELFRPLFRPSQAASGCGGLHTDRCPVQARWGQVCWQREAAGDAA